MYLHLDPAFQLVIFEHYILVTGPAYFNYWIRIRFLKDPNPISDTQIYNKTAVDM